MASLFTNPLQALMGDSNKPNVGPLASAEDAKTNANLDAKDSSWVFVGSDIDGSRWNKSFPYQLILVEKTSGGYVNTGKVFTLPIPPSDLQISTPFAITTSVTLGGIVEEHNGTPLRTINFSGTTGVLPLKGTGQTLTQGNVFQGIFAGTLNAVQNVVGSSRSLAGVGPGTSNLVAENDADVEKGTGYYQFRLLQKFLEYYAAQKRDGNANLRLALAIWKDQSIYLVSPVDFTVRRSANSPWEYQYSLAFRAWRRITLGISPVAFKAYQPVTRDPNAFAQLLNKIQEARRVLETSKDVLLAAQADTEKLLLEPLREVTLFVKDAIGVAMTAADLPSSIATSIKTAVLEATALPGVVSAGRLAIKDELRKSIEEIRDLGVKSGKSSSRGGNLATTKQDLSGASAANKAFDDPRANYELMGLIKPSDLNLSPSIQAKITDEKQRVRQLKRLDFEQYRDQLVEFQAVFADAVGAGSSSYDQTYGRPTYSSDKTPTNNDFEVLFALNQTILELNKLAASSDVDSNTTTVDAVAGMASAAGIAFTTPVSKFAVPFPYGMTIEQLAAQYLGDANRWHEIVALNGLRRPYVDELGFTLPLLINGIGNQVSVSSADDLYLGQQVTISSNNATRTKRRITHIEKISNSNYVVTVDGDPDLSRYSVLAAASLHAFLPDTVNSQQLIYIPSSESLEDDDFRTKSIPGLNQFDQLLSAGGVDLLLTQSGDLAITPDGDCRLAVGLTNIIQQIRVAIGTPKGSLLHHPDYGLGLQPGVSTADLDAKSMLASLQNMLGADKTFSGVSSVAISKAGPVARVSMSVGIAGTNQTIPLTVDIRR